MSEPAVTPQLRAARAAIVAELGAQRLAELHRGNLLLDLLAILGAPALFVLCAFELATGTVHEPQWWLSLVVQGDLVLVMAFINHDAFVHRKLLPRRLRWVLSSILVWPSLIRPMSYEHLHLRHHRALGTDADSELYKQGIATRWQRVLYATPGLVVYRAFFLRGQTSSLGLTTDPRLTNTRQDPARLRWELGTRLAVLACVVAAAVLDWRYVVFGYLLPFVLVTPLLNTVRIVLEHFDLDPANAFWVGTCYRTGPLTRLMFWWDAGDCHLVHHFYANIPFYRVGAALRLMRPILARQGVQEHRSLVLLLLEWFGSRRSHWSVPAAARGRVKPPA